ncbi:MAG: phosphate transport system regulatory protein PhoU [Tenericutes bacterium GWC2_39_45]|nr:MAG: phosphate transport system regulatory protein PhoU [Tenericutes bacterium GWA2_38_26]OHE31205.1 MAG: phosphate transport system regulatory protein PhoU [Tenericutes bacterium GWC2_39_45]OHE31663.1 MAG: phosphate transport system regulatory protein PhoU [Tenericutes bacterium GWD2_38_27]OHE40602.1 MAG: phosphate transport system regulatory protein PhoU [Tenericutes bacterium GWE2_38_8]OHE40956.1 MAG: phosphate transport system regulatory protein PhoU [Tenericutes bacterium GWF2_38_8]HBG
MTLRQSLLQSIEELKKEVAAMADLALANLREGLVAFKTTDQELANQVMRKDDEVDRYEEEIAKQALKIIWKEQPVASDLRLVTGILKLITDLERIGDHASDIAEMTLHLDKTRNMRVMPISSKMAEIVEEMVLESIQALVKVDIELARKVIGRDDAVDDLFQQLITKMTKELKEDKLDPNEAIYVLMVGKYFERVGDHAVNIAEWIIFMKSGTHKNTLLF